MKIWLELHPKAKFLLRTAFYVLMLFVAICGMTWVGLWRVFERRNPYELILLASAVLALLLSVMDELYGELKWRIERLEKRVSELEAQNQESLP